MGVDRDPGLGGIVAGCRVRLPVQLDERDEPLGLAADDRHREREAQGAGANHRLRVPPTATHTGSGSCTGRGQTLALFSGARWRPDHVTWADSRIFSSSSSFSANSSS